MTKADLIERMAAQADISKAAASRALDACLQAITDELTQGNGTTIVGFGSFSVAQRAEREGRNPQTGQAIAIKAQKVAKFAPSKLLKQKVAAQ